MARDPYEEEVLRRLGIPVEEEPSLFHKVTQPVRTLVGATGGIGGKLAESIFGKEAYEQAYDEQLEATGAPIDAPWYDEVEALPGFGDVAANAVDPEARETTAGRIIEPVSRIAGNILGDPTTYTPFVLARVGKALTKAVPAAEAASRAWGAERAAAIANKVDDASLNELDDIWSARVWNAMEEGGKPVVAEAYKTTQALSAAEPWAFGTAAAVTYGPDVARGVLDSAAEAFGAETFADAMVGGANTILMAGLGALMGKGVLDTMTARKVLAKKVADDLAKGTQKGEAVKNEIDAQTDALVPFGERGLESRASIAEAEMMPDDLNPYAVERSMDVVDGQVEPNSPFSGSPRGFSNQLEDIIDAEVINRSPDDAGDGFASFNVPRPMPELPSGGELVRYEPPVVEAPVVRAPEVSVAPVAQAAPPAKPKRVRKPKAKVVVPEPVLEPAPKIEAEKVEPEPAPITAEVAPAKVEPPAQVATGEKGWDETTGTVEHLSQTERKYSSQIPNTPEFHEWLNGAEPKVYLHGSHNDFSTFDPEKHGPSFGIHLGNAEQVSKIYTKEGDKKVYPLVTNVKRPAVVNDLGRNDIHAVAQSLLDDRLRQRAPEQFKAFFGDGDFHKSPNFKKLHDIAYGHDNRPLADRVADVKKIIREAGYDGLKYDNRYEGGGESIVALDPDQVRSAKAGVELPTAKTPTPTKPEPKPAPKAAEATPAPEPVATKTEPASVPPQAAAPAAPPTPPSPPNPKNPKNPVSVPLEAAKQPTDKVPVAQRNVSEIASSAIKHAPDKIKDATEQADVRKYLETKRAEIAADLDATVAREGLEGDAVTKAAYAITRRHVAKYQANKTTTTESTPKAKLSDDQHTLLESLVGMVSSAKDADAIGKANQNLIEYARTNREHAEAMLKWIDDGGKLINRAGSGKVGVGQGAEKALRHIRDSFRAQLKSSAPPKPLPKKPVAEEKAPEKKAPSLERKARDGVGRDEREAHNQWENLIEAKAQQDSGDPHRITNDLFDEFKKTRHLTLIPRTGAWTDQRFEQLRFLIDNYAAGKLKKAEIRQQFAKKWYPANADTSRNVASMLEKQFLEYVKVKLAGIEPAKRTPDTKLSVLAERDKFSEEIDSLMTGIDPLTIKDKFQSLLERYGDWYGKRYSPIQSQLDPKQKHQPIKDLAAKLGYNVKGNHDAWRYMDMIANHLGLDRDAIAKASGFGEAKKVDDDARSRIVKPKFEPNDRFKPTLEKGAVTNRYKGAASEVSFYDDAGGKRAIIDFDEDAKIKPLKADLMAIIDDENITSIKIGKGKDVSKGLFSDLIEQKRVELVSEENAIYRLIREDKIGGMEAREPYWAGGINWTANPFSAMEAAVGPNGYNPVAHAAMADHLNNVDKARKVLAPIARKLGIKLDTEIPVREMSLSGVYHQTYQIRGEDANGFQYVMRVGKSPVIEFDSAARRTLLAPALDQGSFKTDDGHEFTYMVTRQAFTPNRNIDLGLTGYAKKFGVTQSVAAPNIRHTEGLRLLIKSHLPKDVSLSQFMDDAAKLNTRLFEQDLIDTDIVLGDQLKSGQIGYIPLTGAEAKALPKNAVVRTLSDGSKVQLVVLDHGAIRQIHPTGVLADMSEAALIAMRRAKSDNRLSGAELVDRARQYREAWDGGAELGEGMKAVSHDGWEFSSEFRETVRTVGLKPALAMRRVVDHLVESVNKLKGTDLKVEFSGLTDSPWLAGLWHSSQGKNRIFANIVEAVHHAGDREQAIDDIIGTLLHEVSHHVGTDHNKVFQSELDFLTGWTHLSGVHDQYRQWISEALTEDAYNQIGKLVNEFHQVQRNISGQSWREGQQSVRSGAASGSTTATANQFGRGAEGAAGDSVGGVQPRGVVERGTEGQADSVRGSASPDRSASRGSTEGEATGYEDGGEAIAGQAARGESDEAKARRLIDNLIEVAEAKGEQELTPDVLLTDGWSIADWAVKGATEEQLLKWANMVPKPRHGETEGPVNYLHLAYDDLTNRNHLEQRARLGFLYDVTKNKGIWERDRPVTFDQLDKQARDFLDLHSNEEFLLAQKRSGHGITAVENRIFSIIHQNLLDRLNDAETKFLGAENEPKAVQDKLEADYLRARNKYLATATLMSEKRTGLARALAIGRHATKHENPFDLMMERMAASIREKSRSRYRDKDVAEEKARHLMKEFRKVWDSGGSINEFRKAYNLVMQKGMAVEKALEWYKMGLLGWPSQVANTSSNVLMMASRQLENVVAGMLDWTRTKLPGQGAERSVYVGETATTMLAMKRAMLEGWGAYSQEVKDSFLLRAPDISKLMKHGAMAEDLMHMGGAIQGRWGEFVRFHGKMMQAADGYAKTFSRTQDMYRSIYRNVRNGVAGFETRPGETHIVAVERLAEEGLTLHSKAINRKPYDLKRYKLFSSMIEKAEKVAQEETFQAELGEFGRGAQSLLSRHPLLQILVPFFRTPVNIAKQTVERTPFGYIKAIRTHLNKAEANKDMAAFMTDLAKPTTGSLIMGGFAAFAMTGEMTGGGPVDFESQDALRATGWQPYSFRFGNQWVSYQRLEPMSSILGFAADMVEASQRGDITSTREIAEKAMNSIADNLTNKTFLETIDKAFAALSRPQQYGAQFMKQIQGSLMPNSIGYVPVGHLARALDPVYRQTEPLTAGVFWAKTPFMSQTLAPQYGPTGEMRTRPGTGPERLLSPFARQTQDLGPKYVGTQELINLDAVPKTPMKWWTSPEGYRIPLKPEERQLLAKALQKATTSIGQTLVKDPTYRSLPKDENDPNYKFGQMTKQKMLKRVLDRQRSQALTQIMPQLKARARKAYKDRDEA